MTQSHGDVVGTSASGYGELLSSAVVCETQASLELTIQQDMSQPMNPEQVQTMRTHLQQQLVQIQAALGQLTSPGNVFLGLQMLDQPEVRAADVTMTIMDTNQGASPSEFEFP